IVLARVRPLGYVILCRQLRASGGLTTFDGGSTFNTHVVMLRLNVTDLIAPPCPNTPLEFGAAPNGYPAGSQNRNTKRVKEPILRHHIRVKSFFGNVVRSTGIK